MSPAPPTPVHPREVEEDENTSVLAALRSPKRLRTEVLAGLVVALALIPEAISFSIIAGVDPRVGLFASYTMAVSIAFLGGRPAMITAATGAVALVICLSLDYRTLADKSQQVRSLGPRLRPGYEGKTTVSHLFTLRVLAQIVVL